MRWKKEMVRIGDVKAVKKFLFFPLTIENETRWLEYAWCEMIVKSNRSGVSWYYERFIKEGIVEWCRNAL